MKTFSIKNKYYSGTNSILVKGMMQNSYRPEYDWSLVIGSPLESRLSQAHSLNQEGYTNYNDPNARYLELTNDITLIVSSGILWVLENGEIKRISNKLFSDLKSDSDFRNYAHRIMKQAHKSDYSKELTDKVVDDLLSDHPDATYGELIGRLTSNLRN